MLGDYTCSEIELTDDDEPSTKKKQKTKKKTKKKKKKQKAKKVKSDNSENSAKRTIVPSVLIRMRRYLGCAVIYEKNMELQMQKVRRPFNILILYISLFDFFFLSIFPKMTFYQVFSCNVFTMFNEHVN